MKKELFIALGFVLLGQGVQAQDAANSPTPQTGLSNSGVKKVVKTKYRPKAPKVDIIRVQRVKSTEYRFKDRKSGRNFEVVYVGNRGKVMKINGKSVEKQIKLARKNKLPDDYYIHMSGWKIKFTN